MEHVEGEAAAWTKMLPHAVKAGELVAFRQVVQEPTKRRDAQGEAPGQLERPHVADPDNHMFAHLRRLLRELLRQPLEHCRIGVEGVHRDPILGDS
jgi:hypothetical protein